MIAFGLSSLSLSFGASKQVYYNGTTQQVIYYDINPIEWPIHDEYNMERLDNLTKQLRDQTRDINKEHSHEKSENKQTISDNTATQIVQEVWKSTNVYQKHKHTSNEVSKLTTNPIINDKNTIARLAKEMDELMRE